jgi:PadR family transcriptional regulator PadR
MTDRTELVPGTLEMLVLRVLTHGADARLRDRPPPPAGERGRAPRGGGGRSIRPSTGWRSAAGSAPSGETSEANRRAKYYRVTAKGQRRLEKRAEEWERVTGAIARVMRWAPGEA